MPRCAKIVRGKRCKAYCIAGSKFCLFHTPGQGMRRSGKKKNADMDEPKSKNVVRRSTENQLAVRGSKKAANMTAAYGAYLQTRPDYTVSRRTVGARYNKSGKVIVGEHQQTTISKTRSDRGRNFTATDGSSKARMAMGRKIVFAGRLVPVLGYGYVVHNTLNGGQVMREGEGHPYGAAAWAVHDIKQTGLQSTFEQLRSSISLVDNYERMKEVEPFWKK